MDLIKAIKASAAGMKAQGTRLRIVSENLANAQSVARQPGAEPYRRKVVSFSNELDRTAGIDTVRASRVDRDTTPFERRLDPGHPGADKDGFVLLPNVNPVIELMDMREAQRSYEANMNTLVAARQMIQRTVELLRG